MLDASAAQDAAQEALLRAWRNAHTCHGTDPEPWIRVIARREALRIRARRTEDAIPEDHAAGPVIESTSATDSQLDLATALSQLSPDEQRAIFLRYWADKTDQEIATLLEAPIGTIKVRVHRAQKKLAPLVAETYGHAPCPRRNRTKFD